jgi:hypothetical protein
MVFYSTTPLSITQYYDASLQRLRHPTQQRVLWVDSICIHRTSLDARNKQVLLMPLFYGFAERASLGWGRGRWPQACGKKPPVNHYKLPNKWKICTRVEEKQARIRQQEARIERCREEIDGGNSIVQAEEKTSKPITRVEEFRPKTRGEARTLSS